uniref:Uncharacterized protein n=1 Tax=Oryza punctata TaxID=4537 RepID=A0A0E0MEX0_ORYPU
MANLNTYHLSTWADSAKTRNPTRPGSSHENMWLHWLRQAAVEARGGGGELNGTAPSSGMAWRWCIDDGTMSAGVEEERGNGGARLESSASGLTGSGCGVRRRWRRWRRRSRWWHEAVAAVAAHGGGGSGCGKEGKREQLTNYISTQLSSRLTQRPYPIMITQIHYR